MNTQITDTPADEAAALAVSYRLYPLITIDPSALFVAMQYLLAERQEITRAENNPKIAAKQQKQEVEAIKKAHAALQRGYTINLDGSLTITGSSGTSQYTIGSNGVCYITGTNTLCNGWKAAQKTRSSCYHVWAMELLLTAQALELIV
jgi:hypothetical protein